MPSFSPARITRGVGELPSFSPARITRAKKEKSRK